MRNVFINIRIGYYHIQWFYKELLPTVSFNSHQKDYHEKNPNSWKKFEIYTFFWYHK
jgi:hypothetical protein